MSTHPSTLARDKLPALSALLRKPFYKARGIGRCIAAKLGHDDWRPPNGHLGLPVEIWAEIFTQLQPQMPFGTNFVVPTPSQTPVVTICLVCRFWRAIAICTPQLWTMINYTPGLELRAEQAIPRISTWIDRSGALPLSFCLDFKGKAEDLVVSDYLYANYFSRVRDLVIYCSVPFCDFFRALPAKSMPMLRNVRIHMTDSNHTTFGYTFADRQWIRPFILKVIPQLNGLVMQGGFMRSEEPWPLALKDSWRNLTHLHLGEYSSPSSHFEFLSQCINLVHCNVVPDGWPIVLRGSTFTLPRLRTLAVHGPHSLEFLEAADLPVIELLAVDNGGLQPQALLRFLERCGRHMLDLRLDIADPGVGPVWLLLILEQVPKLQSLLLNCTTRRYQELACMEETLGRALHPDSTCRASTLSLALLQKYGDQWCQALSPHLGPERNLADLSQTNHDGSSLEELLGRLIANPLLPELRSLQIYTGHGPHTQDLETKEPLLDMLRARSAMNEACDAPFNVKLQSRSYTSTDMGCISSIYKV
ncbi:hypothetical protein BKA62DRAFT_808359 [Auriculariales sp. MPI-PUGE-AT-0066]|nr:hypothetical protein BKA62DRAFT_808359 [Auriculariales sp. MPI-PUGE-AT-0066]